MSSKRDNIGLMQGYHAASRALAGIFKAAKERGRNPTPKELGIKFSRMQRMWMAVGRRVNLSPNQRAEYVSLLKQGTEALKKGDVKVASLYLDVLRRHEVYRTIRDGTALAGAAGAGGYFAYNAMTSSSREDEAKPMDIEAQASSVTSMFSSPRDTCPNVYVPGKPDKICPQVPRKPSAARRRLSFPEEEVVLPMKSTKTPRKPLVQPRVRGYKFPPFVSTSLGKLRVSSSWIPTLDDLRRRRK